MILDIDLNGAMVICYWRLTICNNVALLRQSFPLVDHKCHLKIQSEQTFIKDIHFLLSRTNNIIHCYLNMLTTSLSSKRKYM